MESTINWNLLAKYLSSECDRDELKTVEIWLSEDPDNSRLMAELDTIFGSSFLGCHDEQSSFGRIVKRLKKEGLMK